MNPEISVIIPTLNEESNIEKTLKSIKNQDTKVDYDFLVCDGGSEDRTVEIAKKHTNILISPIKGKSKQLNYAAENAKGKILIFIDADTTLPSDYLQRLYDLYKSDGNLWACGATFRFILESPDRKKRFKIHIANILLPRYFDISGIFGFTKLPGCNISIKKEIFQEIGGFKDIPNEDSALCTDLRNLSKKKGYGKIKYIIRPIVRCSSRRIEKHGPIGTILYYRKLEKQRFKEQK